MAKRKPPPFLIGFRDDTERSRIVLTWRDQRMVKHRVSTVPGEDVLIPMPEEFEREEEILYADGAERRELIERYRTELSRAG